MTDAPDTKEPKQERAVSPLVRFKQDIGRLIEANELALPSNVSADAFKNAAIIAVQDNPKILGCDQGSVFKSIRRLAAAGLVPDGREAALVPFNTKIDGRYVSVCQAMPMVFGLIKAARNSGDVRDIRAHIVYDEEIKQKRFEYVVGDEERLSHEPILFGEKGPPVACYAIAVLRDGSIIREFLDEGEIDKIRRASSNQRIYQKGERPKVSDEPLGIWAEWQGEMWKKSAIRRLCKRLPLSSEDLRRIQTSDEMEREMRDVTPERSKGTAHLQRIMDEANAKKGVEPASTPPAPEPDEDSQVEDAEVVDVPQVDESSEAYGEGRVDFDNFGDAAICPEAYAEGSAERVNWMAGKADAKDEKENAG